MSLERYTRVLMDTSSAFPIHFLKIYSNAKHLNIKYHIMNHEFLTSTSRRGKTGSLREREHTLPSSIAQFRAQIAGILSTTSTKEYSHASIDS
jgi:hypothetical protein